MPAKLSEKIWIKKLISGRNASYIDAEKSAKEEAPVTQPLRVEYRPAAPRRRRQRTMWPPFVGGWGVFEVIEMKFDIPNVDCNFIVITVP